MKSNEIFRIRDGTYVSREKFKAVSASGEMGSYLEYIATNLIYVPSYLSLEYVLFENGILTENVYQFTLVTTKKTASFKNHFGKFKYRTVKPDFFWDYVTVEKQGFIIHKATPEKALFDWFYLRSGLVWEDSYFEELRLNLGGISLVKFEKLLKKYKSRKLERVFIFLKKLKWS